MMDLTKESSICTEKSISGFPTNSDDDMSTNESPEIDKCINNNLTVNSGLSRGKINARKDRQIKRNSGEAYISNSGKLIQRRTFKSLEKCRLNCCLKILHMEQEKIFTSYWKGGTYISRFEYVSSLVTLKPKGRIRGNNIKTRKYSVEYHLPVSGTEIVVCKKCFLNTLGETEGFVKSAVNKIWTQTKGLPAEDQRGKSIPKNKSSPDKIREIEEHIKKFLTCVNKTSLNVSKMYKHYSEEVATPLSLAVYRKIFKKINVNTDNSWEDTSVHFLSFPYLFSNGLTAVNQMNEDESTKIFFKSEPLEEESNESSEKEEL